MNSPSLASDKSQQQDVSPDDTFENCVYKYADPSLCPDKYTMESQVSADEQRGICRELYRRMHGDSSLSAIDKAVFERLFVDQEKPRDVAMEYNIDQSAVSEIRNRILGKFRDILRDEYKVTSYADV
jgi:DNA-directed RNA polymerase specialized sigma subunit